MTVKVKKPVTKEKLQKAEKLLMKNRAKKKVFDARKFSGKLKGVFGDASACIKRQEILRGLESVPDERLEEIEEYLKSILSQIATKKRKEPKTLKGIWADKGFEKIIDLENEIIGVRKELGNQVLRKKF